MWTKLSASALFMVLLLAPTSAQCQTSLKWESGLQEAARQAAATNRLVLVHFWAPWCTACRKMDQEIFSQPDVQAAIDADYVAVQLNVDHNRPIAQQYGVTELPTDVVVAPDGRLLDRRPGFVDRYQYVARLRQIAVDARRPPVVPMGVQSDAVAPITAGVSAAGPSGPVSGAWPAPGQTPFQNPSGPVAGPSVAVAPPSQAMVSGQTGSLAPAQAVAANQPPPTDFGQYANIPAPPSQPPVAAQPPVDRRPPTENWVGPPTGAFAAGQPGPVASSPGVVAPASQLPVMVAAESPQPSDSGACPFALDGFCPVELAENKVWKLGDLRYGANHRGRTYLFAGPEQQQRFLQDPDRYSPVASGIDVVMLTKEQVVPGRREYGVFCANRVFLFANENTLGAFSAEPERYIEKMQTMNPASGRPTYR